MVTTHGIWTDRYIFIGKKIKYKKYLVYDFKTSKIINYTDFPEDTTLYHKVFDINTLTDKAIEKTFEKIEAKEAVKKADR